MLLLCHSCWNSCSRLFNNLPNWLYLNFTRPLNKIYERRLFFRFPQNFKLLPNMARISPCHAMCAGGRYGEWWCRSVGRSFGRQLISQWCRLNVCPRPPPPSSQCKFINFTRECTTTDPEPQLVAIGPTTNGSTRT